MARLPKTLQHSMALYRTMEAEATGGVWSGVWQRFFHRVLPLKGRAPEVRLKEDLLRMGCIRLVKKVGDTSYYKLLRAPTLALYGEHCGRSVRGGHGARRWLAEMRENHARHVADYLRQYPNRSKEEVLGALETASIAYVRSLWPACFAWETTSDGRSRGFPHTCGVPNLDTEAEAATFMVKGKVGRPFKDPTKNFRIVSTGEKS